jgi:hypothetical protein
MAVCQLTNNARVNIITCGTFSSKIPGDRPFSVHLPFSQANLNLLKTKVAHSQLLYNSTKHLCLCPAGLFSFAILVLSSARR